MVLTKNKKMIAHHKIRAGSRTDIKALSQMQTAELVACHLPPLYSPLKDLFLQQWERRWTQQLEKDLQLLILEIDNEVTSFIVHYPGLEIKNLKTLEIINFHTAKDKRQQGYAHALWHHLLHKVRTTKVKMISTWVLQENLAAQHFYRSLGFESTAHLRKELISKGVALIEEQYQLFI